MVEYLEQDQVQSFKEAFESFDYNDNGKVSLHCLQALMRRAGANPTDVEILDIVNKVGGESGNVCNLLKSHGINTFDLSPTSFQL